MILSIIISSCKNNSGQEEFKASINQDSIVALTGFLEKVNPTLQLENVENDSLINFAELNKNSNTLYFYFTFLHCDDCIKRIFRFFQNNPNFHKKDIAFIAACENNRPLYVLKMKYDIPFNIYRVDSASQFKNKAFQYNKPFFFKMQQGHLTNAHFINFNLPERTIEYLEKQD